MGQRNSKQKSTKSSYEVAPVVSNRDFEYEKPSEAEVPKPKEVEIDTKLVPAWVNEAQFVDLLREHVKNFEKIVNFKAYPAMGAGENYATLMLRVSIEAELKDGSKENISFMMKVPHDTEQNLQMMEIFNIFVPENIMYFDVLPELEQIYKEAGQNVTFAAQAYKFPKDIGKNYVLLADLCPGGFKNQNRLECLDMKHTECVLKMMAQFHAASATRVATKGPFPAIIMDGFQNEQAINLWQSIMSTFQTSLLNNINLYKDSEKYEKKLKTFFESFMAEFASVAKYNPEEFNVLNHGDSWSNNILFKHASDGEIKDTIYVDFQVSKYGSPAQDLMYFIMSSVNIDFKLKHFDYFIRFYYDNLIDNLKLLKYPKKLPTLRELHIQLFKYGVWAVMTSVVTLPVVLLDPTESASIDNFISGDDAGVKFKNAMFSSKRYIKYINEILPWLYDRGLLDIEVHPKPATLELEKKESFIAPAQSAAEKPTAKIGSAIPEWVSEDYFIDVLKQNLKGFKQIKKFEVKRGTNAGDNYASVMLQVDIEAELEDGSSAPVSYMLKVAPEGEQAQAMLAAFNIFNKELTAYDEIIPQLERMYKEAEVADVIFAPKNHHFTKDPGCQTVLMENMRPHGFKNADRLSGLDEAHTKSVLRKLAQFHAASANWCATGGIVPQVIKKSMYTVEARPMFEAMMESFYDVFIESVKGFKGSEEYTDKIVKFKSSFYNVMIKACEIDESGFNVINHGDCWTNNILFRYNTDGTIKDTYFVDFQIQQYGSPAQDLYYFLVSSPSLDIKMHKFEENIEYYYKHLKQNLELLKYSKDIPSLQDIHKALEKYGGWGYGTVVGVMGAVLLDPTEDANMDNMLSDTEAAMQLKKQLYSNPRYRSHAEFLLPWLNKRGLLDLK